MILKHPCAYSGCRQLIPVSKRYCEKHQYIQDQKNKQYEKDYNQTRYERNPLTANYHTMRWKRLRENVLARDNYLCQECLKKGLITQASQVDHLESAVTRPDLFWDMDNLDSKCASCHTRKTLQEQKEKRKDKS